MEGQTKSAAKKKARIAGAAQGAVELHSEERKNIRGWLLTLACSDVWAEHILSMLSRKDDHGRPIIKHKLDAHGFLKGTKPHRYAKLLKAVSDALVYPVPADDLPWTKGGIGHLGSTMRKCYCLQCTRRNPDGTTRHVYWPASYMVKERISYTCSVNQIEVDELEELEELEEPQLLTDRGRGIGMGEAAEQMRFDQNAWRSDDLEKLKHFARRTARELDAPELLLMEDKGLLSCMRAHRWTQVVGEKKAKNKVRGLNNLGSLSDFLELGHSLAGDSGGGGGGGVRGLSKDDARLIAELVDCYPRQGRMRQVRIRWQETR